MALLTCAFVCRIDFAQDIMGPLESVTGSVAQFAPRTKTVDGKDCAPSEVDDWSSMIGKFKSGATGVWEGSTLMKVRRRRLALAWLPAGTEPLLLGVQGYHFSGFGKEWAEVNGSEATAVYQLGEPSASQHQTPVLRP